jgi:serine/threonine protein kinase
MSEMIGKTLGRYHILEQLGQGGMAVVYKAYDMRLERDVAVKVIRTEKLTFETMERTLKRFEREAKSLAKLTHPNIIPITDYGEFEGKPYLVMPYLPGGTLKERIKQGPIPWRDAARLILPIAQALEYAHKQNIIHRDVKPANILLTESGQPMLTDFGVAKLFDMDATADLTGTGMGVGTPEYMAPEQWQGQVSEQTDVYALGVVLYEMVTGRRPYTADTPAALLIKQTNDPLPRPKSLVASLPDELEKVLVMALAKKIEDRYPNVGLFSLALEKINGDRQIEFEKHVEELADKTITESGVNFLSQTKTESAGSSLSRTAYQKWGSILIVGVFLLFILIGSFKLIKPYTTILHPSGTSSYATTTRSTNGQAFVPTNIPTRTSIPPTSLPVAVPLCKANVSGNWSGFYIENSKKILYSLKLTQIGCRISGTSLSGGAVTSTVNGYVENEKFYLTESGEVTGDVNTCYWTAVLTINGNRMMGDATNCAKPYIELVRE